MSSTDPFVCPEPTKYDRLFREAFRLAGCAVVGLYLIPAVLSVVFLCLFLAFALLPVCGGWWLAYRLGLAALPPEHWSTYLRPRREISDEEDDR